MKKFEELRKLAEESNKDKADWLARIIGMSDYSDNKEISSAFKFIKKANPYTILSLLADRENLRECLKFYANELFHNDDMWSSGTKLEDSSMEKDWGKKGREALAKSDEVENG